MSFMISPKSDNACHTFAYGINIHLHTHNILIVGASDVEAN